MLKLFLFDAVRAVGIQPPSGGCVLKLYQHGGDARYQYPAAFGRLCVETLLIYMPFRRSKPAAFGRLCVETKMRKTTMLPCCPAAFGRLCVETLSDLDGL